MRTLPALLLALLLAPLAVSAQSPVQVAFFPPLQIVPEDQAVSGLRISLYGRNSEMTGLDFGVVTHTTGNASALQLGLVNYVEGDFLGVQLGWGFGGSIANVTKGHMKGFQAAIYNGAGSGEGLQWGLVNNSNGRMEGLQLALVNFAEDMNGLQVGLINIIRSKETLSVLPIVNWKFN